jgi:cytochrome P450
MAKVTEGGDMAMKAVARSVPGTLSVVLKMREKGMLQFFMDLWREQGDFAQFKVGPATIILAIHPNHVQHVLVTARQHFEKGRSHDVARDLLYGNSVIGSVANSSWRWQRRLMSPFFTPRSVEQYHSLVVAAGEATAQRWATFSRTDQPVQMVDEMTLLTAWIIVQSMFGIDMADKRLDALKGDIESMITFVTRRGLSALRAPLWVPLPSHSQYHAERDRVHALIHGLISARRKLPQSEWPNDLLSKLLSARDEETGRAMSDEGVRDEALGIFIAGHETTARTLSYLWYALHENPHVAERLRAELDAVVPPDGAPSLQQLKQLPYTLRVIKEALRLYSPVPLLGRDVLSDQELDGRKVPAGATVMLLPHATHRHPDFWDAPESFDPDRWLPEREAAMHPYAYFPFGAGQRVCVGNSFALLEAHILTAMLARRYVPQMASGQKVRFEYAGTLSVPGGLPMKLTARGR